MGLIVALWEEEEDHERSRDNLDDEREAQLHIPSAHIFACAVIDPV